jgi:hypothetical protein|tara:strand:+ start:155 stop:364 length:210 start_codon:yes stop_codon:yes gene_type:complete
MAGRSSTPKPSENTYFRALTGLSIRGASKQEWPLFCKLMEQRSGCPVVLRDDGFKKNQGKGLGQQLVDF